MQDSTAAVRIGHALQSQQHNASFCPVRRSCFRRGEYEFSEVLVVSKEQAVVGRAKHRNVQVGFAPDFFPDAANVMSRRPQVLDELERNVLVGKDAHYEDDTG